MQRKCNLSLYSRKKRVKNCWHCKARLNQSSLFAYCSDQCLKDSQSLKETPVEQSPGRLRQSEISIDEWQQAKEREAFEDDFLWAKQADYWQKGSRSRAKKDSRRFRKSEPQPMVLTGHGVKLRIDRGALVVRNGFTHHPQQQEEFRIFPGDPRMPSRIVLVDTNGYLTLNVINWLSVQDVPLVLMNWKGEVTTVCGGDGTQSDPRLRQAQLEANKNGLGLRISIQLIKDKLKNSQETLLTLPSVNHESARRGLAKIIRALDPSKDVAELRFY